MFSYIILHPAMTFWIEVFRLRHGCPYWHRGRYVLLGGGAAPMRRCFAALALVLAALLLPLGAGWLVNGLVGA